MGLLSGRGVDNPTLGRLLLLNLKKQLPDTLASRSFWGRPGPAQGCRADDDNQLKQLTENKKWLSTRKVEDKIEYKKTTAIAKREVRRRQRNSLNKFVTALEHDLYK
jgi:hypothetical protein